MVLRRLKSSASNCSAAAAFCAGVLFAAAVIGLGIVVIGAWGGGTVPPFASALAYALLSILVIALCLVYTLLLGANRQHTGAEGDIADRLQLLESQVSSLEEKTQGGAQVLSERMLQLRQAIEDLQAPKR